MGLLYQRTRRDIDAFHGANEYDGHTHTTNTHLFQSRMQFYIDGPRSIVDIGDEQYYNLDARFTLAAFNTRSIAAIASHSRLSSSLGPTT